MKLKTTATTLLSIILASAFATNVGQTNPPPKVSTAKPSKVTVHRVETLAFEQ